MHSVNVYVVKYRQLFTVFTVAFQLSDLVSAKLKGVSLCTIQILLPALATCTLNG